MQREAGAAWWWLLELPSAWFGGQLPELPGSRRSRRWPACCQITAAGADDVTRSGERPTSILPCRRIIRAAPSARPTTAWCHPANLRPENQGDSSARLHAVGASFGSRSREKRSFLTRQLFITKPPVPPSSPPE